VLAPFVPVFILGFLATALAATILAVTFLVGPRRPSPIKSSTYESGLTPIGPAQRRVPVRFYLIATLFILFDIEVIYLVPWAVQFRSLAQPPPVGIGAAALVSVVVFLGVLLVGYVYVWRKGALEWD
jgi:NADH-quinone oxidoreductase subunit A